MKNVTYQITINGLVQGVGFRPFVYRIAKKLDLTGWVLNTNEDVTICVNAHQELINHFVHLLKSEAPPASLIDQVFVKDAAPEVFTDFTILESHNISEAITEICPDIAVCEDCMKDIDSQTNRIDYPFVNCTNCGPRFTIIQDLPYDRAKTTMKEFLMCPDCRKEYLDVADRRFHAQPVACNNCGPTYELYISNQLISNSIEKILVSIAELIDNGAIVAIKGLGGMHLACDATNESAVRKLRELKNREAKPFAVMFGDLKSAKNYTEINPVEELSLTSWRRPIVLLKNIKELSTGICSGLNLTGTMLPYMPIHYQLFKKLNAPAIVLTSGNFSSEPILIDNEKTINSFSGKTDAILLHNREIYNRADDSVVRIVGNEERVMRRSRGYVPTPIRLNLNVEGIIAFGAELTNCFAVGKGKKAFMSQHIGDLKGLETTLFYEETINQFIKLVRIKTSLLAVDLHPDYISTRTAEKFVRLPVVAIQHHHAHIASCMAENGLDEQVIGVALDGTGLGDDGNTWGAEFLICNLEKYERLNHFDYVPLPGGDMANEEPWRMAASFCYKVYGKAFRQLDLPFLKEIPKEKIDLIIRMMERSINCPLTSGAGRLFDAVASLLGICQVAAFPAQGPMLLEALLGNCNKYQAEQLYSCRIGNTIHVEEIILQIINDIKTGVEKQLIAWKFHNTIISVIFETVKQIAIEYPIRKVVLSGGVFQNKYLLEYTENLLRENNFIVYSHKTIPTNDGGIALGQMAIAAKRREKGCV